MTHHPHIHMIVPGGGLSLDGTRWVACKPGFFLHVRVLSRLFRRLFIEGLLALHQAGELAFFGDQEGLADTAAFTNWLAPFRKSEWVVYAKPPFGGPETVLAYLSRYTHRVAISNHRLISADADTVAFRWKDYRVKNGDRQKTMRLATPEFIRRFLIHVLPPSRQIWLCQIACRAMDGFHLGRFSNAGRGRANTNHYAATRVEKPSPDLPLIDYSNCCSATRQTRPSLQMRNRAAGAPVVCGTGRQFTAFVSLSAFGSVL